MELFKDTRGLRNRLPELCRYSQTFLWKSTKTCWIIYYRFYFIFLNICFLYQLLLCELIWPFFKKMVMSKSSHLKGWDKLGGKRHIFCDSANLFSSIFSPVSCFCTVSLLQQSFTWRVDGRGPIITSSSHLGFCCLVICGQAAALYRGVVQLHFNPLVFRA